MKTLKDVTIVCASKYFDAEQMIACPIGIQRHG